MLQILSERQIERLVTFANGCAQWTFQTNAGLLNTIDGSLRDSKFAVDSFHRSHVHRFPFDRCAGGIEYLLNTGGYLCADAVAGYEGYFTFDHSFRVASLYQTRAFGSQQLCLYRKMMLKTHTHF